MIHWDRNLKRRVGEHRSTVFTVTKSLETQSWVDNFKEAEKKKLLQVKIFKYIMQISFYQCFHAVTCLAL